MEMKEFGPPGGARVPGTPFRSANASAPPPPPRPPLQNLGLLMENFFRLRILPPQITPRTRNAHGELILNFLMENSYIASLFTGRLPSRSSIDWYIQPHTVFSWTNIYRRDDRAVSCNLRQVQRKFTRIPESTKRVGFKSNAFKFALIFDEVFFAC